MNNLLYLLAFTEKIGNYQEDFFNGWNMPEFKNLRKKVHRRRIEIMLLAGYAVAVTCALVISMFNKEIKHEVQDVEISENYDFGSDILTPAFEDSDINNPFEQLYNSVYAIHLISENPQLQEKFILVKNEQKEVVMPGVPKPKKRVQYGSMDGIYQKERHVVMVQSGDTFIGLLNKLGLDSKNATDAYNVLRKVYDARNLKVGQYILLTGVFNVQSHDLETIDTLTIEPERGTRYILHTNEYDKYVATMEQEKFARDTKVIRGTISGTVANSLAQAGVPNRYRGEIINNFSHMLNFSRDIKKGDTFEVKYEVNKDSYGDVVKTGVLLYASFKNSHRSYKLYRYKNEFYNDKGETKKTGLDKKPLAARNARISSLFGYRRHPILKTQKFHNGVDYAAPRGTAVYASGNGKIAIAKYVNGYGNFIKIRHNSEYETGYGHLQRFASGIRPGVSVRKGQIIAYVGSTGRSTGPHLHFEIIRRGQRINPLKAAVATGNDLSGHQLADFKRTMRQIDSLKENIARTKPKTVTQIVQAEPASLKMTIAQTPQLIQEAQKNLPETQQLFPEKAELSEFSLSQKIAEITRPAEIEQKTAEQHLPSEINKQTAIAEKHLPDAVDNSAEAAEQPTAAKEEKTEKVVSETKYTGKLIYPNRISAAKARSAYSLAKLKANHKFVLPGAKRPAKAGSRAHR